MRNSGKLPCPVCDEPTEVYDTQLEGLGVRRRRRCTNDHRFNTFEGPIGSAWDRDRHAVVPVERDVYDAEVLAAQLNLEREGVDEM
jgi:transcriptional regulator NrdR family protein